MAYLTVDEADAYWAARGNAAWAALNAEQKAQAIARAEQYIDTNFTFIGFVANPDQESAWPRENVVIETGNFEGKRIANDEIPKFVKDATAQTAVYSLTGDLVEALTRGGLVRTERVGAVSVSYFAAAPGGRQFPMIESILSPVLTTEPLRRA